MHTTWITRYILLVLITISSVSFAQNSTTFGRYQINHIAYNSTFLSTDMAKAFNIKRANNIAIINISIQDLDNAGQGVQVDAINGQVKNMFQQVTFLDFNSVSSGDAIYYLDQYRFSNEDALTFSAEITLPNHKHPVSVKWQQTLYKQ